jgi:hypothetical protein
LQLFVLHSDDVGIAYHLHILLITDLPALLLHVPQPLLEVGVLSEQTAGHYFVFSVALFFVGEKDLFQILELALDEVVCLHQFFVRLLRLVLLATHGLVLLFYLLETQLVLGYHAVC